MEDTELCLQLDIPKQLVESLVILLDVNADSSDIDPQDLEYQRIQLVQCFKDALAEAPPEDDTSDAGLGRDRSTLDAQEVADAAGQESEDA